MEKDAYELDTEGNYQLVFCIPLPKVIDYNGAIGRYDPNFFSQREAALLFKFLRTYEKNAENATGITPAGKPYIAERRTLQISDPNVRAYKFNGSTAVETEKFDKYPVIDQIRWKVYYATGVWPNFCLYNAYTSTAKLGWHSDKEKDMVEGSTVISVSFGDTRRFRVRLKSNHEIVKEFYLSSGSMLTMEGEFQKLMDHSVWEMTKKELENGVEHDLRINLTFRVMKLKEK